MYRQTPLTCFLVFVAFLTSTYGQGHTGNPTNSSASSKNIPLSNTSPSTKSSSNTSPSSTSLGNASPGITLPGNASAGSTHPGNTPSSSTAPGYTPPGSTAPGNTYLSSIASGSTAQDNIRLGSTVPGSTHLGSTQRDSTAPGSVHPGSTQVGSTGPSQQSPGMIPPAKTPLGISAQGNSLLGNTPPKNTSPEIHLIPLNTSAITNLKGNTQNGSATHLGGHGSREQVTEQRSNLEAQLVQSSAESSSRESAGSSGNSPSNTSGLEIPQNVGKPEEKSNVNGGNMKTEKTLVDTKGSNGSKTNGNGKIALEGGTLKDKAVVETVVENASANPVKSDRGPDDATQGLSSQNVPGFKRNDPSSLRGDTSGKPTEKVVTLNDTDVTNEHKQSVGRKGVPNEDVPTSTVPSNGGRNTASGKDETRDSAVAKDGMKVPTKSVVPEEKSAVPAEAKGKSIVPAEVKGKSLVPTEVTAKSTIPEKSIPPAKIASSTASTQRKVVTAESSSTTARSTVKSKPKKPLVTVGGDEEPSKSSSQTVAPLSSTHSTNTDYVVPIVAVILSVPLVAIVLNVLYKRGSEWWQHRHYSRMDFLIDGMYNN